MSGIFASLITAIFGGGASGLLGHAIKEFFDIKRLKLNHEHEMAQLRREERITELEIQGRERVAEIDAESETAVANFQAMEASYLHDKPTYVGRFETLPSWAQQALVVVDVIRGLVRPLLTLFLVAAVVAFAAKAADPEIQTKAVLAIIYLATTAVTWWFAGRRDGARK